MSDCLGWILFGGFVCCVWVGIAFHFGYGAGRREGASVERQRIWEAMQAWEENATSDVTFKPLAPYFDELDAIVFPS